MVSLIVLSLVILMMLTISIIAKKENSIATKGITIEKSKQIAILALKKAIASVQSSTGSDMVTTTSSNILDSDPSTFSIDSIENCHWTGVWNSEGELVNWLVSNNESKSPSYKLEENERIQLVSSSELNENKKAVYAPAQEILNYDNQIEGRFAWWVGDESIKAKINAVASNFSHGEETSISIPSKVGLELAGDPLGSLFDTSDLAYSQLAKKILNYKQLENISSKKEIMNDYFHDFTTFSYGVLSDSKNGGLKKDLSKGLSKKSSPLSGPIFTDKNGLDLWEGYGPDWELIRSYLNLRSNQNEIEPRPHKSNSSNLPETYFYHDRPEKVQHGVFPLVARFQVYFYPTWVNDGTGLKIRLFQVPTVVLWNPYDVAISSQDYVLTLNSNRENFRTNISYYRNQYEVLDSSGQPLSPRITGNFPYFIYKNKNLMQPFDTEVRLRLKSDRLEAGQAVVFSLAENQARSSEMDMLPLAYEGYGFFEDSEEVITLPDANVNNYKVRIHSEQPHGGTLFIGYRFFLDNPYTEIGSQLHSTDSIRLNPGTPAQITSVNEIDSKKYQLDPLKCRDDTGLGATPSTELIDIHDSLYQCYGFEITINQPFINFKWSARDHGSRSPSRIFGNYNLRASFAPFIREYNTQSAYIKALGEVRFYGRVVFNYQYSFDQNFAVERSEPATTTFIGYSEKPSTADRAILYHVLDEDEVVHSIGQLRHCNFSDLYASPNYQLGNSKPSPFVNLAIADPNSLLDITSARLSYRHIKGNAIFPLGDWTYAANDSLWDRYFFSTIMDEEDYLTGIDNPRLYPIDRIANTDTELNDYQKIASHLFTNGAFNVNSTSVEAWKNILGIYNVQSTSFNGETIDNESLYPLIDPYGSKYTDDIENNEAFAGFRTLNPSEVELLAKEIVKQVKLYGPFKSLSEFVNRFHDTAKPDPSNKPKTFQEAANHKSYIGVLDAAIYQSGINHEFDDPNGLHIHDYLHTSAAKRNNYYWPQQAGNPFYPPHAEAGMGSIFQDIPAYFKQGDLLAKLGSLLTTRSDTFTIRTCGEAINPTTKQVSTSYCEAIIQRYPEALETSETPYEPDENSNFGRKYRITHFQWLNKNSL